MRRQDYDELHLSLQIVCSQIQRQHWCALNFGDAIPWKRGLPSSRLAEGQDQLKTSQTPNGKNGDPHLLCDQCDSCVYQHPGLQVSCVTAERDEITALVAIILIVLLFDSMCTCLVCH